MFADDIKKFNPLIPYVLGMALFIEALDGTIILTALPSMAHDLHVNPLMLKFAVTGYLLAVALFIPLSGWLTNCYGPRCVFSWAMVLFLFGSLICGFAPDLIILTIGRVIQGIGGAMMTPVAYSVLLHVVPKAQLNHILSLVTIPSSLGPMLGPLFGGYLVTHFNWRWIFFVNIPIGLVGMLFALWAIPKTSKTQKTYFDCWGFLYIGMAIIFLLGMIEALGTPFMNYKLEVIMVVFCAVFLKLYMVHAAKAVNPLIPLVLFRQPMFRRMAIAHTLFSITFGSLSLIVPMFFQLALGISPLQTGRLLMLAGLGMLLIKLCSNQAIRWIGLSLWMQIHFLTLITTTVFLSMVSKATPLWIIGVMLFLQGSSISVVFMSNIFLLYRDVPSTLRSHATSVGGLLVKGGIFAGVAYAAALLALLTNQGLEFDLAAFKYLYIYLAIQMSVIFLITIQSKDNHIYA